jgi:hypothetical protein
MQKSSRMKIINYVTYVAVPGDGPDPCLSCAADLDCNLCFELGDTCIRYGIIWIRAKDAKNS